MFLSCINILSVCDLSLSFSFILCIILFYIYLFILFCYGISLYFCSISCILFYYVTLFCHFIFVQFFFFFLPLSVSVCVSVLLYSQQTLSQYKCKVFVMLIKHLHDKLRLKGREGEWVTESESQPYRSAETSVGHFEAVQLVAERRERWDDAVRGERNGLTLPSYL